MCKRLLDRNAIVTGRRGHGFCHSQSAFSGGARVAILDVDEKGIIDAAGKLDSKYGRVLGDEST